jgi:16S rRNA (uracil1498-N3)-methyltransferase
MRRFCVETLPCDTQLYLLDGTEGHHLVHVLRCKVGDKIELFDGQGTSVECEVITLAASTAGLQPLHAPKKQKATPVRMLCIAQVKTNALDVSIRMATEVGITHIVVFVAGRSIARAEKISRWSRIATAAAKQCGRNDVPKIQWFRSIKEAEAMMSTIVERRLIALPGSPPYKANSSTSCSIIVGPEGGFTPEEVNWALQNGFHSVGLSPWTLRADTAATLAAACIGSL